MLIETARDRGRYGHRDATMILIAYRHGLRAGELCALKMGYGRSRTQALAHPTPEARRAQSLDCAARRSSPAGRCWRADRSCGRDRKIRDRLWDQWRNQAIARYAL